MDAKKYGELIQLGVEQKFTPTALNNLAQEFFPENPDKFIQEMLKLIERCQDCDKPIQPTKLFGKTAELFALVEDEKIMGVLLMKYFLWTLLTPQLYFVCQNGHIFLSPLSNLVVQHLGVSSSLAAAELSYFWVETNHRGHGLGRLLFSKFYKRCQEILSLNALAFTIAKSTRAKTKKGSRLHRKEDFLVRPESYATCALAQEFGFDFLCFNKTLGSLYAKIL